MSYQTKWKRTNRISRTIHRAYTKIVKTWWRNKLHRNNTNKNSQLHFHSVYLTDQMHVAFLGPAQSRDIIARKFNHHCVVPKLTNRSCCSTGSATLHDGCDYRINCNPSIKTQLMTKFASLNSKSHFINA